MDIGRINYYGESYTKNILNLTIVVLGIKTPVVVFIIQKESFYRNLF